MRLNQNVDRDQTQRARGFLLVPEAQIGAVVERFVPNRFREPLEDVVARAVSEDFDSLVRDGVGGAIAVGPRLQPARYPDRPPT